MRLLGLFGVLFLILWAFLGSFGGALWAEFLLLFFGGIYCFPTIVAGLRSHPSGGSVLVINLFFGWTLIGWVISLALACSAVPES
jgi:uncharacterized membrane protein